MSVPTKLSYSRSNRALDIAFEDGLSGTLTAQQLRVESPSAEVQGHGPGQEVLVVGKEMVGIDKMEPIGAYAVRLTFDDGHDTGFYTWSYLATLLKEKEARWASYLQRVAQRSGV